MKIKNRENKHRNADEKQKAAFCGHGFLFDSKTYKKSLKLVKQIIRKKKENRTDLCGITKKDKGGKRYEFE